MLTGNTIALFAPYSKANLLAYSTAFFSPEITIYPGAFIFAVSTTPNTEDSLHIFET